jgi:hypothetical protein
VASDEEGETYLEDLGEVAEERPWVEGGRRQTVRIISWLWRPWLEDPTKDCMKRR